MSEISFQAVQFFPRFVSVLILLALTWLVARFAGYLVARVGNNAEPQRKKIIGLASSVAQGLIFFVMLPFVLDTSGLGSRWVYQSQQSLAKILVHWPIWMILSLLMAAIFFLLRGVSRFFEQLKCTSVASRG